MYDVWPATCTIASLTLRASICKSECLTLAREKSRRNGSESSYFIICRLIQMVSCFPLVNALENNIYAAA
jgi:hypothetical protein